MQEDNAFSRPGLRHKNRAEGVKNSTKLTNWGREHKCGAGKRNFSDEKLQPSWNTLIIVSFGFVSEKA